RRQHSLQAEHVETSNPGLPVLSDELGLDLLFRRSARALTSSAGRATSAPGVRIAARPSVMARFCDACVARPVEIKNALRIRLNDEEQPGSEKPRLAARN